MKWSRPDFISSRGLRGFVSWLKPKLRNRSDVTRDGTRRVPPVEVRCLRALRFGLG